MTAKIRITGTVGEVMAVVDYLQSREYPYKLVIDKGYKRRTTGVSLYAELRDVSQ